MVEVYVMPVFSINHSAKLMFTGNTPVTSVMTKIIKKSLIKHKQYILEGVQYPCNQCEYESQQGWSLKK